MTIESFPKDLVVLVADKNMEFAVRGILGRFQAIGIREISPVFHVHPEHDPGCLLRGHTFLSLFVNQYKHALVVLDHDGCGQEKSTRTALEDEIESRLCQSGWGDRASAVVIDPELEAWVWSDSPNVDYVLGWQNRTPALRPWLKGSGFLPTNKSKPIRPKEALDLALKIARKPRSSSLYLQLAQKVNLMGCIDSSFVKLVSILQKWFLVKYDENSF